MLHLYLAVDYAMDYANPKPNYADHSPKPDYAEMTCPKPDNADHHNALINIKYTPLGRVQTKCIATRKEKLQARQKAC